MELNVENTVVQMRKGILEYCILLVISKGDEVYASDLLDELKTAQIIVVEGTLYPLLNRLYKASVLEYTWKESLSGPPRKYYRLSENGKLFLQEMHKTWKALSDSIALISNPIENA
jgi:PadR family transcriptional regulator, regulatory protein PadR